MWIELSDELEAVLKQVNNPLDNRALAINGLFTMMLMRNHIVYASRKLLDVLLQMDYLNPSNETLIKWIKQKYVFLYSARGSVGFKICVCSHIKEIKCEENSYLVPLEYFGNFRASTRLLTENESDGELFKDIWQYVNEIYENRVYSVSFLNDSFHGSNIAAKMHVLTEENSFALVIVDSDKDTKISKAGSTYKGANKCYKKIRKHCVVNLYMLNVREKENLFPPYLYMNLYEKGSIKTFLKILNKFLDYEDIIKHFDIKDGVKYKKYKDDNWKQYYADVIKALNDKGIFNFPDNDNDDFICIEGIGDKMCYVVDKVFLKKDEDALRAVNELGLGKRKKKFLMENRDKLISDMPSYLFVEWNELYRLLFDWGCCLSAGFMPRYKM